MHEHQIQILIALQIRWTLHWTRYEIRGKKEFGDVAVLQTKNRLRQKIETYIS